MDLRGPQHQAAPQREAGRRPPVRPALEGHDAVTVQQHLHAARQAGGSQNQDESRMDDWAAGVVVGWCGLGQGRRGLTDLPVVAPPSEGQVVPRPVTERHAWGHTRRQAPNPS